MRSLTGRVLELSTLRARAAEAAAELKRRREAFEKDNAALIQNVRDGCAAAAASETALRAVALEIHKETGSKAPAPGIEIKMFKEFAVDEEKGLAWATEKQLCLIPAKLDVAAIKKLATVQPLPFVLITEVPKVTIATDLSKLDLRDSEALRESVERYGDDEPVQWEGQMTTWGELSGNERMECARNSEGRLVGGNPF